MADEHWNDLTIRSYQYGEEYRMAELVNSSRTKEGQAPVTVDMIREEWSDPRFDLERDSWVAVDGEGRYVAAAEVWFEQPDEEIRTRHIGFTIRPEYRDSAAPLLEELVERAIAHASSYNIDGEQSYRLRAWASANDEWKQQWSLEHGFRYAHCAYSLVHDTLDTLPPIEVPAGVRLEPWSEAQDHTVWQVLNEGFADDPTFVPLSWEEWQRLYHDSPKIDPTLWQLAIAATDERVIGLALTEIDDIAPDVGSPQEGWITDLAVLEPWRGRGVGHALLLAALHALRDAGITAVMTGLDADGPGATELYEDVGFRILRGSCTFHRTLLER